MNAGTKGEFKVGTLRMGSARLREDVVVLSAANIIAMNGAAVTIIAAPLAGLALIVESILFAMLPTATQFTGGGVVTFQYAGGAVVHASSIPASVVTSASASNTYLAPNTQANGVTVLSATAITITNATAAFATGTGTAKVFIRYRTVVL